AQHPLSGSPVLLQPCQEGCGPVGVVLFRRLAEVPRRLQGGADLGVLYCVQTGADVTLVEEGQIVGGIPAQLGQGAAQHGGALLRRDGGQGVGGAATADGGQHAGGAGGGKEE